VTWVIVGMGLMIWWIGRIGASLPGAGQAEVESDARRGVALAAVLPLAYALFLLYWFSRGAIRAETQAWSIRSPAVLA